ncbi:breast carcinoma amplified sequence 2-domain-containing protein [Camillea tinctor]|nr:breast carcinoma amplified sequence 2-domain-containing protein [Camillea tinctor]
MNIDHVPIYLSIYPSTSSTTVPTLIALNLHSRDRSAKVAVGKREMASSSSSIRTTVHESLPYIDPEPTPSQLSAAQSLIDAELATLPPPSPPSYTYTPQYPALLTTEHDRIASGAPPTPGIDLSRYEAQTSSSPDAASLERAYAAHSYLSSRASHLALLERYGKNAWLVSNWAAEAELAALERELAAAKRDIDLVNLDRRRAQDAVAAEVRALQEAWRGGVGRVLETEVAAEGVRREILERRRLGAEKGGEDLTSR